MAEFNFYGRNNYGIEVRGKRSAFSAEVLASQLIEENITPINIELIEQRINRLKTLSVIFHRKIPTDELRMFSRQMYTLIKSGIPIVTSVTRLAETTRNVRFSQALSAIADSLSAGKTLSSAMESHRKIFSPLFINVIRVGESSGRLDQAFLQISSYLGLEEQTLKRVKSTLRYPIFVIFTLIASLIVVNIFVIPAFEKLFSSMDTVLPLSTRILMSISSFLLTYWPLLLILAIVGLIALRMYFMTNNGKYVWSKYQLNIPLVGWLIKRVFLTRFCRTFALIIRSGISIMEGMPLVAAAMGNAYMEHKIYQIQAAIGRGESLGQAAAHSKLFSPLIIQMIVLGEETGKIEDMLSDVAEFYEREVDYDLDKLSDLIEPILLIFLAFMVMVLAMGVFLPMWDMINFTR